MISRRYTRRQRPSRFHIRRKLRPLSIFLLITAVLVFFADMSLRPNIAKALRYQGKILAIQVLSEQTLSIIEPMKITYDDISHISRDENGNITSIQTDMAKLNIIKSKIENQVTSAINDKGVKEARIPIGTLLGSVYLSGRGPSVPIRIVPVGVLQTEFVSRFQSAGINQTNHQIILNISLDLSTIAPMHNAETFVSTNLILAENIIVGDVPEYYTNIVDGDNLNGLNKEVPNQLDVDIRRHFGLT